jgi:tRNA (guanine37-N1)-methyltransferase
MMHFHFIALFPEVINQWMTSSILGRARNAGLFDFTVHQLRDFSEDKHRTVDDTSYGGGGGMVLKVEPLAKAVETLWNQYGRDNCLVINLSPSGQRLNQELVQQIGKYRQEHFILVCGHYEGTDERFVEHWTDIEVSLGDFVLTGGEIPAIALADALIRQLEGALGAPGACLTESFALKAHEGQLLEYPQYTKPAEFRGYKVPQILLSGDHGQIDQWRREQAYKKTLQRRPDLLCSPPPNKKQP